MNKLDDEDKIMMMSHKSDAIYKKKHTYTHKKECNFVACLRHLKCCNIF